MVNVQAAPRCCGPSNQTNWLGPWLRKTSCISSLAYARNAT